MPVNFRNGTMAGDTEEAREAAKMNADVPEEHAALGCTSGCLPEAIIIWEILVRLPANAVLRFRTVCTSWCRLTSTREFVLAHHRHQPPLPIVHIRESTFNFSAVPRNICVLDPSLEDAILRPIMRYTPRRVLDSLTVHASCDGLLLISLGHILTYKRRFYLCNPATRWRSLLRQLVDDPIDPGAIRIVGLYPHRASSEYRVLYWSKSRKSSATFHVLTLGSDGEPRCIGHPMALQSVEESIGHPTALQPVEETLAVGLPHMAVQAAVLFRGNLYWGLSNDSDIMVFDTVAETLRCVRGPSVGQVQSLFEMAGTVAMICRSSNTTVDLWLLQDYEAGLWTFRHQIDILPLSYIGEIDVAVFGEHGLLVHGPWCISYCDIKGRQLRIIDYSRSDMECTLTSHRLQVSLAPLTFFGIQENDDGDDPPFFEDLLSDSACFPCLSS